MLSLAKAKIKKDHDQDFYRLLLRDLIDAFAILIFPISN